MIQSSCSWVGRSVPRSPHPIRAVLSADAITTRLPSGLNAAPLTMFGRCMGLRIYAPVAASHMCAVVSGDAVTTCVPSGLNCALMTQPACCRVGRSARRSPHPTLGRAVFGCGHHRHPVRTERDTERRIAISVRESITLLTAHPATPRKRPMRPWATKRSRISSPSSIRCAEKIKRATMEDAYDQHRSRSVAVQTLPSLSWYDTNV
jgi:hypothetical protein